LFETNIYKTLDKTILVTAPITLRIERLKKRDKLSENEIKKRIDSQWSDLEKQKLADYSIVNDEKILILPQIITIHKTLINQS
jgi:dephospho-CoA kinase